MEYIRIYENGIHIVFGITEDRKIKLLHFSSAEFNENDLCKPKKSCKALPLSEKVQVLDLIRKEKNCMLMLLRSTVRTNLLSVKL